VTSLARAGGAKARLEDVAREAADALAQAFGWQTEWGDAGGLERPAGVPERVLGGVRRIV
jgi:hypothetical protein